MVKGNGRTTEELFKIDFTNLIKERTLVIENEVADKWQLTGFYACFVAKAENTCSLVTDAGGDSNDNKVDVILFCVFVDFVS